MYEKLIECPGFTDMVVIEDFIKLLKKNKVKLYTEKNAVCFEKEGKVLQAHPLDSRLVMFELLCRNGFILEGLENE